jgi:nitroreductase
MTFNPIQESILQRRSIFPASYLDTEISKEALLRLLTCAHAAPTHKRTQPWSFHVVQKSSLSNFAQRLGNLYEKFTTKEAFSEKKKENIIQKVNASGALIVISVRYQGLVPDWEELAATACAVQNLWLAAASEGIGGYWSTPGFTKLLKEELSLESNQECIGLFYLGYHQESQRMPTQRHPLEEHLQWL